MRWAILRSNGENEARAHAWITVPASPAAPALDAERVVVVDPRRTATISGPPRSSGPRNLEQKVWPAPKAPGIELPDRRPLTKAQRFWIDPELLVEWEREEAERRQGAR
jgi:hypothetical protein